jgi:hypothetical protein
MFKQALTYAGILILGGIIGFFLCKMTTKKVAPIEVPILEYRDTCIETPIDSLVIYKEYKKRLVVKGKTNTQTNVKPIVIIEKDSSTNVYQFYYEDSLMTIKEDVIVMGELLDFSREVKLDTPFIKEVQIITVPVDNIVEVTKIVKVPEDPFYQFYVTGKFGYPIQYGGGFGVKLPQGQLLQLDAGRMGEQMLYELEVSLPLWKKTTKSR